MAALRLYRASLRMAVQFPAVKSREKLKYLPSFNINNYVYLEFCVIFLVGTTFVTCLSESDPAKVEELVAAGWKYLETMKKLAAVDEHTLSQIFPGAMK